MQCDPARRVTGEDRQSRTGQKTEQISYLNMPTHSTLWAFAHHTSQRISAALHEHFAARAHIVGQKR
jgi:hypothetical protein